MYTRFDKYLLLVICLGTVFFSTTPPVAAEPIAIGGIFARTGIAAKSNQPAILGTELAVREINRRGGVLGRKLELLLLDNNSTPIGSHVAAEQAALAGVTAIIGSVWSSHSLAIARVAEQNKIPMISTNSTIPSLTAIGDHIFRVCYDDNFQGAVLARFAVQQLKAGTALVFVDIASDFSLTLAAIFHRTFQSLGGTIVKEIEYKAGDFSYLPQVRQALGYQADIVFLAGHNESGIIAEQLQQAGMKAIPIGSDGWDNKGFLTSGGNKIEQGYYISHWLPTNQHPLSRAFLEKYGSEGEIVAATALAYDAVNILVAAIGKAGSSDSAEIRRSLHSLRGFPGITGNISFDAGGNAQKQGYIIAIRQGTPDYLRGYTHE
jgi:branched-chain amino acid transport system substrate-binding protein